MNDNSVTTLSLGRNQENLISVLQSLLMKHRHGLQVDEVVQFSLEDAIFLVSTAAEAEMVRRVRDMFLRRSDNGH